MQTGAMSGAHVVGGSRAAQARWVIAAASLAWTLGLVAYQLAVLRPDGVGFDWVGWSYHWSGMSFVLAGLVAWKLRPASRSGLVMVVAGVLTAAVGLTVTHEPVLWTLGNAISNLHRIPIIYLLLTLPRDRGLSQGGRAVMALGVVYAIATGPVLTLFVPPQAFGCAGCDNSVNLLFLFDDEGQKLDAVNGYLIGFELIFVPVLLAAMAVRFRDASGPARRVLAPAYVPGAIYWLGMGIQGSMIVVPTFVRWFDPVHQTTTVALSLLPFAVLASVLLARARRGRVGEMVLDLGDAPTPQRLEQVIARSLRDPSVRVGYWVSDVRAYADTSGNPLAPPPAGDGRAATMLERNGAPLAMIVHDAALLEDPGLVDSVAGAARLAIENERLQAEVRAQLAEVRASRARIIAASDEARKRIERNLHDGAQQRLVTVGLELRMIRERAESAGSSELCSMIDEAEAELSSALDELRELAQGLHPSILSERGLRPALRHIAERVPLPVEVEVPAERFREAIEVAAYFVAAEALTNVVKYASASRAEVRVSRELDVLSVEVVDDGVGGADMERGSGLSGLMDRVATLGGRLVIDSPPGAGTRVRAELPCT